MAEAIAVREVSCASDIEAIWRIVTDTDRMGRALGFEKIEVRPLDGAGAARHHIVTKLVGLALEYDEKPFEWSEPERFASRRVCTRGPLRKIDTTWTLSRLPGRGTQVRLELLLEASTPLLAPVARLAANKAAANQVRAVMEADERLQRGLDAFVLPPLHAASATGLDRAEAALRGEIGPRLAPLAAHLSRLVREGADPDVGRLRPFELAARWGADRRDVLATCLTAVSAGLLDLSWDLVCPSCRTASERLAALSDVAGQGHCQLCEISFGVDLERAIEATFRPAAAVRVVEDSPLCISGPARTPHVVAQALLSAAAPALLRVPAQAGRYRVWVRGGASANVDVEPGAAESAVLRASGGAIAPASIDLAPGGQIRVERDGADEVHVKLERSEWASHAATAWHVSTLPAFRRLFSSQVLKPGLSLKVARATILFTDLTASTALYACEGDAVAFRLVQDHFDVLATAIDAHHGAVVKTIGDAVMAVFDDEADGVRGAVAMQQAFNGFRAREALAVRRDVRLRVGVHAGPCYVVTANKILDYFGQSVNVAARLQGKAEGGEIVMAQELADRAEAGAWLAPARVLERFVTPIKGLEAPLAAARMAIPEGA